MGSHSSDRNERDSNAFDSQNANGNGDNSNNCESQYYDSQYDSQIYDSQYDSLRENSNSHAAYDSVYESDAANVNVNMKAEMPPSKTFETSANHSRACWTPVKSTREVWTPGVYYPTHSHLLT